MDLFQQSQDENSELNQISNQDQLQILDSSSNEFCFGLFDNTQHNENNEFQERDNLKISKVITKQNNDIVKPKDLKKKKKRLRQANVQFKANYFINPSQSIHIFHGAHITHDGMISISMCLKQIVFSYESSQIVEVSDKNDLGVVHIELQNNSQLAKTPIKDALQYMKNIPDQTYHQIAENLYKFQDIFLSILDEVKKKNYTQEEIDYQDLNFNQFCLRCNDYFKQYNSNNPFAMFQYGIGRLNLKQNDFEFCKGGFSKAYLQLLGLDNSSFQSMLLRHKEVDLLQDRKDILNLSLIGLHSLANRCQNQQYTCNIKTFDGFPLKLYFTKKRIFFPDFEMRTHNGYYEFMLSLSEFDVDFQDLQNLIKYRQKLSQGGSNLTLNEFIQKELSYQFEDVEYSVLSQQFIEKYYKENLQKLKEFEQQQSKEFENVIKQQCSYKYINQQ